MMMMMFSASDFFDRSEQSWNQSWSPQTFTENKPLWFLHQLQVSVFFIKGAASWLSGTFVYGCSFIKTIFSLVCTQWCFLHLYSFITFNTFKLFPAVFHFSTKLSQKIIFKLFRLRLKFKQISIKRIKWNGCVCARACARVGPVWSPAAASGAATGGVWSLSARRRCSWWRRWGRRAAGGGSGGARRSSSSSRVCLSAARRIFCFCPVTAALLKPRWRHCPGRWGGFGDGWRGVTDDDDDDDV